MFYRTLLERAEVLILEEGLPYKNSSPFCKGGGEYGYFLELHSHIFTTSSSPSCLFFSFHPSFLPSSHSSFPFSLPPLYYIFVCIMLFTPYGSWVHYSFSFFQHHRSTKGCGIQSYLQCGEFNCLSEHV